MEVNVVKPTDTKGKDTGTEKDPKPVDTSAKTKDGGDSKGKGGEDTKSKVVSIEEYQKFQSKKDKETAAALKAQAKAEAALAALKESSDTRFRELETTLDSLITDPVAKAELVKTRQSSELQRLRLETARATELRKTQQYFKAQGVPLDVLLDADSATEATNMAVKWMADEQKRLKAELEGKKRETEIDDKTKSGGLDNALTSPSPAGDTAAGDAAYQAEISKLETEMAAAYKAGDKKLQRKLKRDYYAATDLRKRARIDKSKV